MNRLHATHWTLVWLLSLALAACAPAATPATPTMPLPTASPTVPPTPTPLPTAEGIAEAYFAAWQRGDYAAMYALITPENQAALSAQDFELQYRSVQDTIMAMGLTVELTDVTTDGDSARAQARVSYATVLIGALEADLDMPLRRTAQGWAVAYSPALIWPELVDGQKLYLAPLPAERGSLYDRHGEPMVKYTDAYALGLVPGEIENESAVQTGLSRLLGVPAEQIRAKYEHAPLDQYLTLAEVSADLLNDRRFSYLLNVPGIQATPYTSRFYYGNGAAAHVTGYTIFIPPDQLSAYAAQGYFSDQRVGNSGLEKWAETMLAGQNSAQLVLLDANNKPLRPVTAFKRSTAGQDVYTTVDFQLQQAVQFALGDFTAAAAVLKRDTGEVLALASSPTFDPNLFDAANRNSVALRRVLDDQRLPLINRAAQASSPAGSVFKVVTMGAGLASGLFTPASEYACTGEWNEVGLATPLLDWLEGGHGRITLIQGLAGSCNPYFWHIGFALFRFDPGYLSEIARGFGLGQATGIGQLEETTGLIPDPDWKKTSQGQAWEVLDSLNLSIGQGNVLVTPLQIARMMAAVGNGGTLHQPQLVLSVRPAEGAPTFEFQPVVRGELPLSPEQLAAIQQAMFESTQEPLGTARQRFRGLPRWLRIAGKTGTAEDPGIFGSKEPNAWFAGYTFANRPDKPDIAIAVMVENQGQGSAFAAPIFRRIVESYFGLNLIRYPWESSVGVVATPTPTPGPDAPGAESTPVPPR